jgi:hypothetical protein
MCSVRKGTWSSFKYYVGSTEPKICYTDYILTNYNPRKWAFNEYVRMARHMSAESAPSLDSIFNSKYDEFLANLRDVFPELAVELDAAAALTAEQRIAEFRTQVLSVAGDYKRDVAVNPGTVLPGVTLTADLWDSISATSQKSIQEYLTLLAFSVMLDGTEPFGEEGKAAFEEFMGTWKDRMSKIDFSSFTDKFASLFGMKDGAMPKLPEKFLKGHLAKLAEEMMRDFKPEDFGLDVEELKRYENEPSKAFEMLMRVYTTNPAVIQKSIQKIGKRLQAKIQSGAINPKEIAAEAEELMKEFSSNPAFVDMMGSFKSMFGMEDPDLARQAGREGSARLALVKERMRKKVEARKTAGVSVNASAAAPTAAAIAAAEAAAAALAAAEANTPQKSKQAKRK